MKKLFFVALCIFGISLTGKSQESGTPKDTIQVLIDNDRMIVTEYVSTPGKDVCGMGNHSHNPHLTVLLTDANLLETSAEGKSQNFELKAGTTLWSEAETHTAINKGDKVVKVLLIEAKRK